MLVYERHPNALVPGHKLKTTIVFFCMDSAFHCTVFTLNAFIKALQLNGFRDMKGECTTADLTSLHNWNHQETHPRQMGFVVFYITNLAHPKKYRLYITIMKNILNKNEQTFIQTNEQ